MASYWQCWSRVDTSMSTLELGGLAGRTRRLRYVCWLPIALAQPRAPVHCSNASQRSPQIPRGSYGPYHWYEPSVRRKVLWQDDIVSVRDDRSRRSPRSQGGHGMIRRVALVQHRVFWRKHLHSGGIGKPTGCAEVCHAGSNVESVFIR